MRFFKGIIVNCLYMLLNIEMFMNINIYIRRSLKTPSPKILLLPYLGKAYTCLSIMNMILVMLLNEFFLESM